MDERGLFQLALGLEDPWQVSRIEFNAEEQQLDIHLDFPRGAKFKCPKGGELCPVQDTEEHTWRHLNFFQHVTRLHARRPRTNCPTHGILTVDVPWARPRAGFTLLFEALVMVFARNGMTPTAIGRVVGEHDTLIWRIVEHYVDASRAKQDHSKVTRVGIDETSRAKGHDYVTIFADMDESRVLFATEGKDHTTVERFARDLEAHGGDATKVTDVSMDMSGPFQKGVEDNLPQAKQTFDHFHVIKLVNDAVDEVRREEQRDCPDLKNTRYVWLKNERNMTDGQRECYQALKDSTLKTARACRIKFTLQELYAQKPKDAETYLRRWYFWATHSRLEPMIRAARSIKKHWDGVLRWFESKLTNGLMEGINSLIQAAKARARGFRSIKKLVTTIYLIAGKLDFDLPQVIPSSTNTK